LLRELKENFLIGNKYVSDPTPFNLPGWVPMSAKEKLNKAIKNIDNIITGMMNERCSTDKYDGKLLANIMDQKDDDGRAINREDALAEIKNVFISSFFSTSDLLSWLVYSLAQYPCWADKIYYNCKFFKEQPDPRSLENCVDMQLFIHEVLRFYSPAWASSHRTLDPLELDDYIIPKHVTVLVSIYNLHRHPAFWGEPETFNPERFRSFHEQREKAMFIPFGLGPRKCVGMGLATLVINIVCAKIVCNFNLSVNERVVPAVQSRVSLGSKDDLEVFISPR
jgi:cytochrome P450